MVLPVWPDAAQVTTWNFQIKAHARGGPDGLGQKSFGVGSGARWVGSLSIAPMALADAFAVRAWFHALVGRSGAFLMPLPSPAAYAATSLYQGTLTATGALQGASFQWGEATAQVGHFGVIGPDDETGQLVQIVGVLAPVVDIRPRLRQSYAIGALFRGGKVRGRFRLAKGAPPIPIRDGRSSGFQVEIEEDY